MAGVSSIPSNFRRAASIASLRAAGRGGGGLRQRKPIVAVDRHPRPFEKQHRQTHNDNRIRIEGLSGGRRRRGRAPAAASHLALELRHRLGALRRPHELDELGPVAELVRAA